MGPPGPARERRPRRLQQDFSLLYLATGAILRGAVEDGTPLGKEAKGYMDRGELVPDEVIVGVIVDRLGEDDAADGFLLDGFPRTIAQAEALEGALGELGRTLTAALLIDVPDEVAVRRISGRRVCQKAGHVYHVDTNRPKHDDMCDIDGSRLIQRDDDNEETVRRRLEVYRDQTAPLIGFYEDREQLRRFDGERSPTEVHDHIRATLATLRLEEQI